MITLAIVIYVLVLSLLSYSLSDKGHKPLTINGALLIASWPLLVAAAPFYFVFIFIREWWAHR